MLAVPSRLAPPSAATNNKSPVKNLALVSDCQPESADAETDQPWEQRDFALLVLATFNHLSDVPIGAGQRLTIGRIGTSSGTLNEPYSISIDQCLLLGPRPTFDLIFLFDRRFLGVAPFLINNRDGQPGGGPGIALATIVDCDSLSNVFRTTDVE